MIRSLLMCALLLPALITTAQVMPESPLARETGREMALKTIDLVEQYGLPPRSDAEYHLFKASLLQMLDEPADTIDRQQLYLRIQLMLNTLDSDGHSFLFRQNVGPNNAVPALPVGSNTNWLIKLIDTPLGRVLQVRPPQTTATDDRRSRDYIATGLNSLRASDLPRQACAVVIDLSEQKGGNAWPPMAVLKPLFSPSNSARFVDRHGQGIPVMGPDFFETTPAEADGGSSNPLTRFARQPLAFVMTGDTTSAGEMIAVALLGEGERVRSFGWASYGKTTANRSFPLADHALLVLSGARYGIADQPVIRGKIAPQEAALSGEDMAAVVDRAANWTARRSSLCQQSVK